MKFIWATEKIARKSYKCLILKNVGSCFNVAVIYFERFFISYWKCQADPVNFETKNVSIT